MTEEQHRKELLELGLSQETLAIRAGHTRTGEQEHAEAIFPTSSYVYASAAEAAARFSGEVAGNIYSRFTNPTVRTFEERLAAMEGAERCVGTASGMAAILSTFIALLKAGDHIVCSRSVFGTTVVLLNKFMAKFGVEVSFVELGDMAAWQQAIRPQTKMFFLEAPSNPLGGTADIRALADLAHGNDILLTVDNCFCTPALQQPFKMGADLVIHSATKYLDGQGRCLGGAVLGNNDLIEEVYGVLRTCGPSMSPFNAWVFLKGLETLNLRMQAHSRSALILAQWLASQDKIDTVHYNGLPSHPQHELAAQQQSGFSGVLAFEVKGGQEQAWQFIDATQFLSITANLGDAKSTITHPATTTHGRLTPEEKAAAGITPNLIRVSVGLENVDDLQADLARGLAAL
jgi:O-succinylhomoserine sulfhydrylase